MSEENNCSLATTFTVWEKLYAQTSFIGMGLTGTIGILKSDPLWILPYLFLFWYGIPGIIMRHLVCPRCPHLHVYGDCLQLPVFFTRILVKGKKDKEFSRGEKALFLLIMLGCPTYPVYWLLPDKLLLTIFSVFALMWYGGQYFRFCKLCRVENCPFNRAEHAKAG